MNEKNILYHFLHIIFYAIALTHELFYCKFHTTFDIMNMSKENDIQ